MYSLVMSKVTTEPVSTFESVVSTSENILDVFGVHSPAFHHHIAGLSPNMKTIALWMQKSRELYGNGLDPQSDDEEFVVPEKEEDDCTEKEDDADRWPPSNAYIN